MRYIAIPRVSAALGLATILVASTGSVAQAYTPVKLPTPVSKVSEFTVVGANPDGVDGATYKKLCGTSVLAAQANRLVYLRDSRIAIAKNKTLKAKDGQATAVSNAKEYGEYLVNTIKADRFATIDSKVPAAMKSQATSYKASYTSILNTRNAAVNKLTAERFAHWVASASEYESMILTGTNSAAQIYSLQTDALNNLKNACMSLPATATGDQIKAILAPSFKNLAATGADRVAAIRAKYQQLYGTAASGTKGLVYTNLDADQVKIEAAKTTFLTAMAALNTANAALLDKVGLKLTTTAPRDPTPTTPAPAAPTPAAPSPAAPAPAAPAPVETAAAAPAPCTVATKGNCDSVKYFQQCYNYFQVRDKVKDGNPNPSGTLLSRVRHNISITLTQGGKTIVSSQAYDQVDNHTRVGCNLVQNVYGLGVNPFDGGRWGTGNYDASIKIPTLPDSNYIVG